VKLKSFKPIPVLIATVIIGLACLFQSDFFIQRFGLFHRQELATYDQRIKIANRFSSPCAVNLAFVRLDEATLKILNQSEATLNMRNLSWPYPRQMHGRLVRELAAQGAKAISFDIIFGELRPFDNPVLLPDQSLVESDDFFANQMRAAGNVILAAEARPMEKAATEDEKIGRDLQLVFPPPLFETNAMAVGDIAADSDSDGILRRARAFVDDPQHGRRWHMGILLAAKELGLDLDHAVLEPGKIILSSTNGIRRTIPVDSKGFFYINWSVPIGDPHLTTVPYALPVLLDQERHQGTPEQGQTNYEQTLEAFRAEFPESNLAGKNPMSGKLVVIGSTLSGNNAADRGPTPLNKSDYLVSKHWNVANSVITGQFIRRSPYALDFLIIAFMGIFSAVLTLKLRALSASLSVVALIVIYIAIAFFAFVEFRYWIPIVLPVVGAMLMTHVCMVTYRVRVEQKERRRVKAVFSRMVSPSVMNVVLTAEKLSLGGARHQITVFFADVRGFTEMTDLRQSQAEEYVRSQNLTGAAAEAYFDEQAKETLSTVNLYLGAISDQITRYNGTLDKYIGDCVMAYWGAPVSDAKHALHCVLAAIASQRAIYDLNQKRAAENQARDQENATRETSGQPRLEMLPLLSLGTGINTGTIIAGMMGSDTHGLNYTVFGREVNLASRLEGVSGRGRIIIGESTFLDIQRDDPKLAATCVELPSVTVKGIKNAVKIYEVPWKLDAEISQGETRMSSSPETAQA
jgi:adenylate cyclase